MVNSTDPETSIQGEDMVEATPVTSNRSTTPHSDRFAEYIRSNWARRPENIPAPREEACFTAPRRELLSQRFPGRRLIIPAGNLKQRSNDTDYPFRAHTAFTWLTAWGSHTEPGSVLVFEPMKEGHTVTIFFRERAGRTSDEFYANSEIGEFWIGPRPSLTQVAADLAIATRDIADFDAVIATVDTKTLIVRDADPDLTRRIDVRRTTVGAQKTVYSDNSSDSAYSIEVDAQHIADIELARILAEFRLVKDVWEITQTRAAVAATARAFDDVIRQLPRIIDCERGERLIEGTFYTRARADGNAVGYDTIAAAGAHTCILHWTRNDGPVISGDLVLLDAGVELDSYYTADITRTFPVNGTFSDTQRMVYETVREAADAAFAIVCPGIRFREIHAAAMTIIAQKTAEWGMLPVSFEEALHEENQYHRRYMVHGTSHHLGLDVHDCAHARREMYLDGVLEPGMIFTIEPGLYFQPDDLTVPEKFRGIGVRIEDNILVTPSGAENLSAAIPRTADDVEAWVRRGLLTVM
jgi:Xaa-Pro aminopeptidase